MQHTSNNRGEFPCRPLAQKQFSGNKDKPIQIFRDPSSVGLYVSTTLNIIFSVSWFVMCQP